MVPPPHGSRCRKSFELMVLVVNSTLPPLANCTVLYRMPYSHSRAKAPTRAASECTSPLTQTKSATENVQSKLLRGRGRRGGISHKQQALPFFIGTESLHTVSVPGRVIVPLLTVNSIIVSPWWIVSPSIVSCVVLRIILIHSIMLALCMHRQPSVAIDS